MRSSSFPIQIIFRCGPISKDELHSIEREIHRDIGGLKLRDVRISHPPSVPAGTKAKSDPATIILSGLASAGVFTALIEALRAWTLRRESRRIKIRVERNDQVVEFDYSPTAISTQELTEFSKQILDALQDQEDSPNKADLPDKGDD